MAPAWPAASGGEDHMQIGLLGRAMLTMVEEIKAAVNPQPILQNFGGRLAWRCIFLVGCHIAVFWIAAEEKSEKTGGHLYSV
jgi:hypothetical protein